MGHLNPTRDGRDWRDQNGVKMKTECAQGLANFQAMRSSQLQGARGSVRHGMDIACALQACWRHHARAHGGSERWVIREGGAQYDI